MASLSEKLRRERELRGISLKQISDDTKIGVRFLEALEEDKLELIPGEFYRRSYLRAYARYLGLDEDRAVNAYAFANQEKDGEDEDDARKSGGMAPWLPWVLAACALFFVVVMLLRSTMTPASDGGEGVAGPDPADVANASADDDGARETRTDPQSAELPAPSPPPAPPKASSDVPMLAPPTPSESAAVDGALSFVVAVSEACWLEIEADGEIVTTGLKEVGFRRTFSANNGVRLWLGNAGGVSFWINGRPVRSLGRPGQVRKDLSITMDNWTDFVSAGEGRS